MIDIDKYKGHTEAPWLELEVDKVVAYQFDENDNPKMICNVFRDGDGGSAYEGGWGDNEVEANQKLIADAPLFLAEVKRLREALITVQQSLVWDEKDRAMDGDPITLEAFVVQVEQVRSNITEMIE